MNELEEQLRELAVLAEQLRELAILVERLPLEEDRIRYLFAHISADMGLLLHDLQNIKKQHHA